MNREVGNGQAPKGGLLSAIAEIPAGISLHAMHAAALAHKGHGLPLKASPMFFILYACATEMHGLRAVAGAEEFSLLSFVITMTAYALSAATLLLSKDEWKHLRASAFFSATIGLDAAAALWNMTGSSISGGIVVILGLISACLTVSRYKQGTGT